MYVHNIFFNELYVMPLCPFHYLRKKIIYFIYIFNLYVLYYVRLYGL